jgi:hypothetical protein
MICKQSIVDTLLRLKDSFNEGNNNKIASLMANPNRSKKDNENIVLQIIDQMMQNGNNKDLIKQDCCCNFTSTDFALYY